VTAVADIDTPLAVVVDHLGVHIGFALAIHDTRFSDDSLAVGSEALKQFSEHR
jgi:hypothetical protein